MNRSMLVSALVALLLPAHARGARSSDCQVGAEPVALSPELCAAAGRFQRIFDQLLASAGLGTGDGRFDVTVSESPDAYRVYKTIGVTSAYLDTYGGKEHVVVKSLSHEIGHLLQMKAGITSRDSTFKAYESHADVLGFQIAARAGFSPETIRRGMEEHFTCARIRTDEPDEESAHPLEMDRWINLLLATPRLRAPQPAEFRMLAGLGDFDAEGRLTGLGAGTLETPKRLAAAQACGLTFDGTLEGALAASPNPSY
ncbi:MAG: hypothetical protein HY059_09660 [Proteobacteria bacterium]|nr:hypothetical protein [Pseudomonadota bacterium]